MKWWRKPTWSFWDQTSNPWSLNLTRRSMRSSSPQAPSASSLREDSVKSLLPKITKLTAKSLVRDEKFVFHHPCANLIFHQPDVKSMIRLWSMNLVPLHQDVKLTPQHQGVNFASIKQQKLTKLTTKSLVRDEKSLFHRPSVKLTFHQRGARFKPL